MTDLARAARQVQTPPPFYSSKADHPGSTPIRARAASVRLQNADVGPPTLGIEVIPV